MLTTAGKLPAKHVIRTVGAVWHHGSPNEAEVLRNCYLNGLTLAVENKCKTIAFPPISTGIHGVPLELVASSASRRVKEFLESHDEIEFEYLLTFEGVKPYEFGVHQRQKCRL